MINRLIYVLSLLLLNANIIVGQIHTSSHQLEWNPDLKLTFPDTRPKLQFNNCTYLDNLELLPIFHTVLFSTTPSTESKVYLSQQQIRPATAKEKEWLDQYRHLLSSEFSIINVRTEHRNSFAIETYVLPIRINASKEYELLKSFSLIAQNFQLEMSNTKEKYEAAPSSSVLSQATFYKFSVQKKGVYKLSYSDLVKHGIISGPIPSNQLAVFGNPSGMLKPLNSENKFHDLNELSTYVEDQGNGIFENGDFILFYGEESTVWKPQKNYFEHQINYYDDFTYYFISPNYTKGTRNRILTAPLISEDEDIIINQYNDYQLHHQEIENVCESGLQWVGEVFRENNKSEDFSFLLQDAILDSTILLKTRLVSTGTSSFTLKNNAYQKEIEFTKKPECAEEHISIHQLQINQPICKINLTFNKVSGTSSNGYLDYLELNYYRKTQLPNTGQFNFRSFASIGLVAKYQIFQANVNTKVWKINSVHHIEQISTQSTREGIEFKQQDSELKEYVAFNSTFEPTFIGKVENQNLHELSSIDYVIVSHPNFLEEAETLAKFHRGKGLSVAVVTPQKIYNEFSSGAQDPIAIRRLMILLANKSITDTALSYPRYLLLMGAASYDYKNKLTTFKNYVPNFQDIRSLSSDLGSISTDDDFGYLGEGEGIYPKQEILDISIGRFPVTNKQEAQNMVNKVLRYSSEQYLSQETSSGISSNYGDWKNTVTFIADDGESFDVQYEAPHRFSDYINRYSKNINVEKLYGDAYKKVTSSVGMRSPDLKHAIKQRMGKGALFVGYMGHSGWDAWSNEKILMTNDINEWDNINSLPMMFASSCSFSLHDRPSLTSGGELSVLNPNGGAISMVAASRSAITGDIEAIQSDFVTTAVQKVNGEAPRIGDAFYTAKINNRTKGIRVFNLLGDPALEVALPKHNVQITTLNSRPIEDPSIDTLKALSHIQIEGIIEDKNGNIINNYQGVLQVSIFDKMTTKETLGNMGDNGRPNPKVSYTLQNSIIYKGKTNIENGKFQFQFIVPKDISYQYGLGKISFYAYSESMPDANGYCDKIVIGGFNSDMPTDTTPPELSLYINKDNYLPNDISNKQVILIADISDDYGINTTGAGIGHDITLTIDGDYKNAIPVNEYFEYNINSYTQGRLSYPLKNLAVGKHEIQLKVWNIFNISTQKSITIEIVDDQRLGVFNLQNAPNPLYKGGTNFHFSHNAPNNLDKIEIYIYNMMGSIVNILTINPVNSSSIVGPIYWDGTDANGKRLSKGMYFYRARIRSKDKGEAFAQQKMIIVD